MSFSYQSWQYFHINLSLARHLPWSLSTVLLLCQEFLISKHAFSKSWAHLNSHLEIQLYRLISIYWNIFIISSIPAILFNSFSIQWNVLFFCLEHHLCFHCITFPLWKINLRVLPEWGFSPPSSPNGNCLQKIFQTTSYSFGAGLVLYPCN